MKLRLRHSAAAAILLLLSPGARPQDASAEKGFPFCPAGLDIPPRPVVEDVLEPGDIHVLADDVDLTEGDISHLTGHVQMTRDQQQVVADKVDYSEPADNADLWGDVRYWDESVYLQGKSAHLEFEDGTGSAQEADYRVLGNRGHGSAAELFWDVGKETRGTDIEYSTCEPEAEGPDLASNAWKISAREIILDHEEERGTAKHVVLRVKDIPVLYSPFLSFPLSDKRKSGFLMPAFGTSSNHGFEVRTPYYLNIAPQFDATVAPRLLTDNGVMAMGEFRYLFPRAHGQFGGEYLPSDNEFGDKDRSLINFVHEQTFARSGRLYATYNRASDERYLEDFGSQLAVTSARYLERRADLTYRGAWWDSMIRVQDYQTMDRTVPVTSRPYERLPQVRFNAYPLRGPNRLNFNAHVQFDNLDREDNDIVPDVHGARLDFQPFLSYPLQGRSAYLTPRLGLQFTQYDLNESGPFKSSPSRLLPIASVDSGVYFERDFDMSGSGYRQTLEPRLYYLYVPDDDQTDLPVFDTGIFNLSYEGLFRNNRFTGPDRLGDANRFTLAFTQRLFDAESGNPLAYFRIAESYYLSDVDVVSMVFNPAGQLVPFGATTDDPLGPIIGEAGMRIFNDWNLRSEIHWQPSENITEKLALRLLYHPLDGRLLNLAYRVRRSPSGDFRRNPTDIEQSDISFRWPLTPQWALVGRWNYAVPEGKSLEIFGGIEYESCCFGVRAVARRFLNNLDGDHSTGVYLQVELKGLAGIGKRTTEFLTQNIPGYESEF